MTSLDPQTLVRLDRWGDAHELHDPADCPADDQVHTTATRWADLRRTVRVVDKALATIPVGARGRAGADRRHYLKVLDRTVADLEQLYPAAMAAALEEATA